MGVKHALMKLTGQIDVPQELIGNQEPMLLHLSDTPSQTYRELDRLIRRLRPEHILHTGDLSDCVKLEKNPGLLSEHEREARKILRILEEGAKEKVYVTLGNHDNEEVVASLLKGGEILSADQVLSLGGKTFRAGHYGEALMKAPADFNLYGHNFDMRSHRSDGKHFLNGVENIHVITLQTFRVYALGYPWMTNDYRYRRRSAKL